MFQRNPDLAGSIASAVAENFGQIKRKSPAAPRNREQRAIASLESGQIPDWNYADFMLGNALAEADPSREPYSSANRLNSHIVS